MFAAWSANCVSSGACLTRRRAKPGPMGNWPRCSVPKPLGRPPRLRSRSATDAYLEREGAEQEARAAFRADLGPVLGESTEAHWMDRIEVRRHSGRTGVVTRYLYDIVTVRPKVPLPDGPFAGP